MAQTPLYTYYEDVESLSDRLSSTGAKDWAEALITGMRGSSTSGEVLQNIGVVLRDLAQSPDAERFGVEEEVGRLETEGRSLWNGDSK